MLDFDLAEMYNIQTKVLKQSVRRNIDRFPNDFMFELSQKEWDEVVTICDLKLKYSHIAPFAFTEQGVAMLSSVLRSPEAIQINISIMRAFVTIRKILYSSPQKSIEERVKALEEANEELLKDLNDLSEDTQNSFDDIYIALSEMASKHKKIDKPRNPIGFKK